MYENNDYNTNTHDNNNDDNDNSSNNNDNNNTDDNNNNNNNNNNRSNTDDNNNLIIHLFIRFIFSNLKKNLHGPHFFIQFRFFILIFFQ